MVSEMVSPANAVRPVSISYRTQPNAQMSVRLSTVWPRACSGLIYLAVPRMIPSRVTPVVGACNLAREIGCGGFRQTEVEHLDRAIRLHLDVAWFEISMNDSFFVCGFEGIGNLMGNGQRLDDRHWSVLQPLGERRALHQFEDERIYAVSLLDSINRCNVRMIQQGEQPRLPLKAGQALGICREEPREHFDGDLTSEPGVSRAYPSPMPPTPRRSGVDTVRSAVLSAVMWQHQAASAVRPSP